jgi:hypothetical protein
MAGGNNAAPAREQCRLQHEQRNIIEQDTICRPSVGRGINIRWRDGRGFGLINAGLVPVPAANHFRRLAQPVNRLIHSSSALLLLLFPPSIPPPSLEQHLPEHTSPFRPFRPSTPPRGTPPDMAT